MKILIADDEAEIRHVLRLLLENKGYEVAEAKNGDVAVSLLKEDSAYDLVVMDVMMPVLSGITATKRIREFSDVPILFLTAKSLESDKARAYTAGGDDYLVKPFSSRELLMKVEALTRRYNTYRTKDAVEGADLIRLQGDVVIEPNLREVYKGGVPVEMREKEMDVLLYLAKNRGRVISPAELYEAVWEEMPLPSSGNTVTVHILNLRRALEDAPSSPKIIRTVWGRGYQID